MNNVVNSKRVALYIRVSSQEQAEKYGKKVQLNQMKKWVELYKEKFTLDEKKHIYIDDGYSGASEIEEREALPKLFQAAKRGELDVVLVWKLDRFFRQTQLLLNAVDDLKKMGIGFISTTQTEIDTTSPFGKVILVMLSAVAEMERDLIIERTGAGRMEAAEAGKFVGGMHTYGYDINSETQKIEINPERAKIVRKLFKWFVKDRLNSYEVQQKINALKIPTQADIEDKKLSKKGKLKKSKRTKNPPCFWHTKTIRRVLTNEAYTGKYYYGKRTRKYDPVMKKKVDVQNPSTEWIKIICPKIVDRHTWDTAKKLLEKNEQTQKRSSHIYLLTGKVFCGVCGSSYQGYLQPKVKMANGVRSVSKYPNYRCSLANITKAGEPCRNRQISGRVLEELVWKEVHALLADPAVFIRRIETEEKNKEDTQALQEELVERQKELVSVITEFDGVAMLFQKGLKYRGKGELEKETDRLLAKQKRLESDLDRITSRLMSAEEKRDRLTSAKNLAKKYAKDLDDIDFKIQKTTVQDLVNRVIVFEKKIRIEMLIPKPPKSGDGSHNQYGDVYGVTGRD